MNTVSASVIETKRLLLRELNVDDAPFVLELLNDPDFLLHIGDKGVRNLDDARKYILDGPVASYAANGHGLYHVAVKGSGEAAGICGLVRRPTLPGADVGYAFLPAFRGMGYAREAAAATLEYARTALGMTTILAVVSPANDASARLLEKVGMKLQGPTRLGEDAEEVLLFST